MSSKASLTSEAPAPIGPYSQGVVLSNFKSLVFVSGQIGSVPESGQFIGEGVEEQTEQALKNMGKILEASGSDYSKVVKTTILLASMDDFATVNKVYAKFFTTDPKPARATFAVKTLPKNALVEIEAIAYQ
jgi:2-iminobutanoate/2-iminopropanoate deaminase